MNAKTPESLVLNAAAVASKGKSMILELTMNLLPSQCRLDTLEGIEHTVVPMVILTEGVHHGSAGPMLYPKDELMKTPEVWNQKPVVVYHPTMNGQGVSACDPVIINSRKVGVIMNTKFENGKLKSEAWIRADRADKVDERIMSAINTSEMMELSTGLFFDMEEGEGNHNGEPYNGIARNYRPDHLALLPDQIGACSIADGAGFLRNQKGERMKLAELAQKVQAIGLAANEMSHDDVRVMLSSLLSDRFNVAISEFPIWVMDVFANFVVYENDGTLFRLGYTSNDSEVSLSDETPVEVKRVSEYRTVNNTETNSGNNTIMEKTKMIDAIVGNADWADQREALNALSEVALKQIHGNITNKKEPTAEEAAKVKADADAVAANAKVKADADAKAKADADALAANAGTPKVVTAEEYIAAAPPAVASVLNNALHVHNEEKGKIVAEIIANEKNTFTKENLDARELGELRQLVTLMGAKVPVAPIPTYGGQAPTPTVGNAETEEALGMPVMNFDQKK